MRVGTVGYSTSQGIGHLTKSFYDAGVITDIMIYQHPHGEQRAPSHMEWYPAGTHKITTRAIYGETVERFLDPIDVMLFIETPFDWAFANRCHERGIKTVIIPMHEWFPPSPLHKFDLFLNPSLLDQEYFPQGTHIPIPVEDPITWTLRNTAKRFLHNAGHIGSRNHKGTLELLRAMEFVTSPIELTIRCQDPHGLSRLVRDSNTESDRRITFVGSEIERDQLFSSDFDVYIAPEKYNGLSLPLQEAFASGMCVMTTNRFPHNQWLPEEPLIPVSGTRRISVGSGYNMIDESIVDPHDIAATIDKWYGASLTNLSLKGEFYKRCNSWTNLKPRYIEALENLV